VVLFVIIIDRINFFALLNKTDSRHSVLSLIILFFLRIGVKILPYFFILLLRKYTRKCLPLIEDNKIYWNFPSFMRDLACDIMEK